ncbi:hypothetical protein VTN00DRAFT_1304 [Thermoascus crustaceus]|uniref:uncharacterized protein n=1 Tax=Thermoascus crustaceus TaxID=5088 RepID=UPI0037432AD7
MIVPGSSGLFLLRSQLRLRGAFTSRCFSTKPYEPLRILFCGSDEFSIASLKALHEEHLKRPDSIASIDVVCRPGKRVGRGLKKIREVPIKDAATKLALPIHEIDTFTGWSPPLLPDGPINLIVAVSFGLFVPPRILKGAKYGGLNVHPSLLPDFRGPAPLHHTLLAGRTRTGVTLQTLHHEHFDHGVILDQTPAPGFEIPNPDSCTVPELLELVAPKGAEILVNGIRNRIFIPPVKDAGWRAAEGGDVIHAAKIKPEDRHINWASWTWTDISRRNRVLGPLWSKALVLNDSPDGNHSFQQKRIIFTKMEEVERLRGSDQLALIPGVPFTDATLPVQPQEGKDLYVFTRDSKLIRIYEMKVEGEQAANGLRAALKARMMSSRTFHSGDSQFTVFHNPLQ